jgi:sulfite exporter TauE/SafE
MATSELWQKPLPSPRYPITRYASGVLLGWHFRAEKLKEAKELHYLELLNGGLPCMEVYIELCIARDLCQVLRLVLEKRGEL